jgi:hypothetical protein
MIPKSGNRFSEKDHAQAKDLVKVKRREEPLSTAGIGWTGSAATGHVVARITGMNGEFDVEPERR